MHRALAGHGAGGREGGTRRGEARRGEAVTARTQMRNRRRAGRVPAHSTEQRSGLVNVSCVRGCGTYLVRGRVFGEADVAIDSKDL